MLNLKLNRESCTTCHVNLLFHVHTFSPKPKGNLPLLPATSSLQNSPETSVYSMPQHLARGISQVHASVKQIKSRGVFFKVWEMFGWNNVTADIMEVIQHLLFLAGRKLTAARQGKLFSNVIALNHPAVKRASLFYFFSPPYRDALLHWKIRSAGKSLPQVCLEWLLSLVTDINCISEGSCLCSWRNQAQSVGEGDGGWVLLC